MKKRIIYVLLAIIAFFAILYSCSSRFNRLKIIGAWHGDGSLDMLGMAAPYEFATQMEFDAFGTLVITNDKETLEFTYAMTDDTLTLRNEENSWGVGYTIRGNTLSIKTGDGSATFTKTK